MCKQIVAIQILFYIHPNFHRKRELPLGVVEFFAQILKLSIRDLNTHCKSCDRHSSFIHTCPFFLVYRSYMAAQDPIFRISDIQGTFRLFNSSVGIGGIELELGPNLQTPTYDVLVEIWKKTLGLWQVNMSFN